MKAKKTLIGIALAGVMAWSHAATAAVDCLPAGHGEWDGTTEIVTHGCASGFPTAHASFTSASEYLVSPAIAEAGSPDAMMSANSFDDMLAYEDATFVEIPLAGVVDIYAYPDGDVALNDEPFATAYLLDGEPLLVSVWDIESDSSSL